MASWHADFNVGEWRVSPKLHNISKEGKTVVVKHKSMAVLVSLADANGDVVSRDDIMDMVWPRMAVTDDVLTQSIVELRKAFNDDAKHPKFIETIPKVGFRLLASVSQISE
ncbi:MAG: transcriptional regulator, partial [Woeseiaceae bacterium]|nr:transcriptional regulator [Woeseiaceae bacterium]